MATTRCWQIVVLTLVLTAGAEAQWGGQRVVTVLPAVRPDTLSAGQEARAEIALVIAPGYHINSHKPFDPDLIPTDISLQVPAGVEAASLRFPEGVRKKLAFSADELSVYEDTVVVTAKLRVERVPTPSVLQIRGTVSFQPCTDQACFPPDQVPFALSFAVTAGQSAAEHPATSENRSGQAGKPKAMELTADELRAQRLLERGLLYAVAAFFVLGLALNLTPCVYPVLPLTVSYFASRGEQRRGAAFAAALVYVVGIAIVFSALGLISGLAGRQWGFLFQSPWFVAAIALIVLAMAASMFGAFEITVPSWLLTRVGGAREGMVGGFVMGLTVGLVIAPCAAGIIIGLVGLVAKLGIVGKGALFFFVMGLGLGLPYLVLATFSQLLSRLPKAGMWMVWIRKLFGVLLIGVALYFVLPQAERAADMLAFFLGLLTMFGGLLLGFLDHGQDYTRAFKLARAVFGVVLLVGGAMLFRGALHEKAAGIEWVQYQGQEIEQLAMDKPALVEFYADWCAPCKQMERTTFRDPQVVARSRQFLMVRVDCTAPDAIVQKLMQRFRVTGMPTLVFLEPGGTERTDLREVGALNAAELLARLESLQAQGSPSPQAGPQ
ncbi:MAG: cytochrome c biogenesis protein CcdA [bacterium]|jgi:thiol:disulfide interchange protein DsbD|nr:thioredoxin domain-containing protein [candidate division KSB1 bacterium]MDH7560590.1 cytochrome c biogenesis protein CcdA [bacterium]